MAKRTKKSGKKARGMAVSGLGRGVLKKRGPKASMRATTRA